MATARPAKVHRRIHMNEFYSPLPEPSPDELAVREALSRLQEERGSILNDPEAALMASQLHTGQVSAMYSLASTGAIREDLVDEIHREAGTAGVTEQTTAMYDAVGTYAVVNGVRGPVEGWSTSELPTEPIPTSEELMEEAWHAWLGHVGNINAKHAAETFRENYMGLYPTAADFARELLTRQDAYQTLEAMYNNLPDRVRRFLKFDEEAYVESLTDEYYFAPARQSGLHVFIDG